MLRAARRTSFKGYDSHESSVTRWLDYFSIFGHLHQRKLPQNCHKYAKVGSAFCQIRNKLPKICQRLFNFCQKVETSPNLVTLHESLFFYLSHPHAQFGAKYFDQSLSDLFTPWKFKRRDSNCAYLVRKDRSTNCATTTYHHLKYINVGALFSNIELV